MPKDIYDAFKSLPIPVLKADYFRYIALYLYGGTYTDTDTLCVTPIDTWNNRAPGVNMIISIEAYNADINFKCEKPNDYARGVQFIQWTFSSVKGHPILWNVINRIKDITPKMIVKRNRSDCDVLDWTGPGIWSDAILDYLNITDVTKFNIQRPRLYKDIYILPTEGFKGSRYYHPETKVQHLFSGSWKNKIDKIN
ncbi:hypothetical protein K502DRAFT_292550 [Neoconidiobolus thromboides FSU 785]|nr:hypothetical protein K502DRAFT_292550 [Neoconidiobolus thromboides FSU 785]